MNFLPSYTHVVNAKLKHIYLSFDDEGTLIVKSPKVSTKRIEQVLLKKSSWINSSRKKLEEKKGRPLLFLGKDELYFLGKAHLFTLITCAENRTKLSFDGDVFTLHYSVYDTIVFQKLIDNFYKNEAKQYIPHLVEQWSKTMNLNVGNIRFRKAKRQWGSCSSKNNLSFNTMMMKLPKDVIQYIVIHELAHIRHKHHQKDFWDFVETYLPEYKTQVKTLKNYTT